MYICVFTYVDYEAIITNKPHRKLIKLTRCKQANKNANFSLPLTMTTEFSLLRSTQSWLRVLLLLNQNNASSKRRGRLHTI